jgi:hypothetical protein
MTIRGVGPRTIGHQLGREDFDPVTAKTSRSIALWPATG